MGEDKRIVPAIGLWGIIYQLYQNRNPNIALVSIYAPKRSPCNRRDFALSNMRNSARASSFASDPAIVE